jgi:hypothetical protein
MTRARIFLTLAGFILGFAAGLVYSWILSPVEYTDTAPASLRQDFKEDYLSLVASAYVASGDLNRARSRLALLGISASPEALSRLAQSRLAAGRPESEARSLAQLAAVLGERPSALIGTASPTPPVNPAATSPTATISPSPTIRPSTTPSPTPGAPFALLSQEAICDSDLSEALIQVLVRDSAGEGIPGVQVLVVWNEGQDRFYTGLKPELGAGYADFTMEVETIYSLQLSGGESPVTGLTSQECISPSGEPYPGSWLLIFQQPSAP